MTMRRNGCERGVGALVLAGLLALGLVACGGSSGGSATPTNAPTTTAGDIGSSTSTAPPTPLRILVTNDDGVGAPGIDALVKALETLPDVTLNVVAPLAQQSGTGGKTTDGPLKVTDAKTASGHAAKAVDGFPADTIRAAFDDLGMKADLVIAGINAGQNLGPVVDVSGTVGAARAAVAKDIPALAVSSGVGEKGFDFAAATPFVLDWVKQQRGKLVDHSAAIDVTNMNVPSCATGKVKELVELPAAPANTPGAIQAQECGAADAGGANDIEAFNKGYVTLTEPLRPAA